jgi:hypothetical protein
LLPELPPFVEFEKEKELDDEFMDEELLMLELVLFCW